MTTTGVVTTNFLRVQTAVFLSVLTVPSGLWERLIVSASNIRQNEKVSQRRRNP